MHGTFKGDQPRPDPGRGGGAGPSLALRILAREACFGSLLYLTLGKDPRANAVACLVIWAALVMLTHRSGLLDRKDGKGLLVECLVIFCGALLFRNLLVLLPTLLDGRS